MIVMLSAHVTKRQRRNINAMLRIAKDLGKNIDVYLDNIDAGFGQLETELFEAIIVCDGNQAYWRIVNKIRSGRALVPGINTYIGDMIDALSEADKLSASPSGSMAAVAQYMVAVNEAVRSIYICINKLRDIKNDVEEASRTGADAELDEELVDDDSIFDPKLVDNTVEVIDKKAGQRLIWLDTESAQYNQLVGSAYNLLTYADSIDGGYLCQIDGQLNAYNMALNKALADEYRQVQVS